VEKAVEKGLEKGVEKGVPWGHRRRVQCPQLEGAQGHRRTAATATTTRMATTAAR